MPKSKFLDFKAVKAALTMEQVLAHYGLIERFSKKGDSLSGPCPIHKGSNPTQFRVSISKNVWNCFSECKHGGNVLDFIAGMEKVTVHAAALKAIEWFNLDLDSISANQTSVEPNEKADKIEGQEPARQPTPKPVTPEGGSGPNKPLKFRLDKLDRSHAYIAERGLTMTTIVDFGVGYCSKGMMAERLAIPIHNPEGQVVAYVGRYPGEAREGTPKYKLPPGFRKSLELFNIDRAIKEPDDKPLVIVEGFFDCMKLHQHGCRKVVALMGSSMSQAQEDLIRKHTAPVGCVVVMLDEDEAGQAARDEIAARLAKFCFVKTHVFDTPGAQPESLSAEELQAILGGGL